MTGNAAAPAADSETGNGPSGSETGIRRPLWIAGAALFAILLALQGSLDEGAQTATDRVFRQALITYAAARSLDAAVSLAEGTELALEPGGVGVTLSAGEILEPLDDLVEQFSSVMLVSATSLGLQGLLLRASAWSPLTLLLLLALVARVTVSFAPGRVPEGIARFIRTATGVLLILRFAVPLYALGTSLLFERYLEPGQVEAVQALEETGADVREMDQLDEAQPEPGLVGRVSSWFSGAMQRLDVSERIEALRDRISGAVDHLMHLLVVFVLQTLLLPLAFLWGVSRVLTAVTTPRR